MTAAQPAEECCPTCGAPYEPQEKWNGGDPQVGMFPTCTCEEDATARRLDERWGPVVSPPPDPVLEAKGWPFYEARLSIHVRPSKPTDTFGEGGDELAHVRAWTQAPSFPEAVDRLDSDLGTKWAQVQANAALVDMPPSPEVMPKRSWLSQTRVVPVAHLVALLLVILALCVLVWFA